MRMSARENDPGYANYDPGGYEVYLDGVPVEKVITADEEEGFVLRFVTGPDGDFVEDAGRDRDLTETVHGKVEIRRKLP